MKASDYQERFWLEWQLDPTSSKYNESFIYEIIGSLEIEKLRVAMTDLARKHPLLRSQFYRAGDELCIEYLQDYLVPLDVLEMPLAEYEDIQNNLRSFVNIPFNLGCGPLWRWRLIKPDVNKYWLAFSFHHIILDGNSFELFRRELSFFYNHSDDSKTPKSVEEYNLKFAASLVSMDCFSSFSQLNEKGLQYYRNKLVDIPLYYSIPTKTGEHTTLSFSFGRRVSRYMEEFCQKNKCSSFRFMATIFSVFLYQYFGQKKFCMAYPVNMRSHYKMDANVLGSFINMQLFPLEISSHSSLKQIFLQISASRSATREFNLPYEKLIHYLKNNNVIDASDIANVVISETDLKLKPLQFDGLQIRSVFLPKMVLPYDISLEYQYCEEVLDLQLSINNHWFDAQHHGEQLRKHLQYFIEWANELFEVPINGLHFLTTSEMQMLEQRCCSSLDTFHGCDLRIEEKFEHIVRAYPHQIAIIDSNKKVTYRELSRLASAIATNLAPKLPEAGILIGISMQHGIELVALMIALFKSQKGYLPLRPELPVFYINEIIAQSELKIIITDHEFSRELAKQVTLITINDLLDNKVLNPIQAHNFQQNDIAYVLYTSGTTGIPKGVMVKHGSIVNLVVSCQRFYNISSSDVIPWFHSYGFDFSVWEIWAALLNGATLLVLNSLAARSPRDFTQYIEKHRATVINQTPTALKQWINYLSDLADVAPDLSSVRIIITGGEALHPQHVEKLLLTTTSLNCRIFNMYGITEDTVHSTVYEIDRSYLNSSFSTIGKMLPGKYGLVVDENNVVKPMGCPGDLIISGFGVAQGYFNNELMTQERFVKLPNHYPDKIWFKTGDQVRLLPSGNLEYLGRKDSQIKIRGYRIDYKDIEMRLSRLRGIVDIKVLIDKTELIAFLILETGASLSNIISQVKVNFPYYMIPGKFIPIDIMPRTINDKIDEKYLLKLAGIENEPQFVADKETSDPTISQVFAIWKKILPRYSFDIHDNFFDCGGNSVLLATLHYQLEKYFSIKLSLVDFFTYPTVSEMSKLISRIKCEK